MPPHASEPGASDDRTSDGQLAEDSVLIRRAKRAEREERDQRSIPQNHYPYHQQPDPQHNAFQNSQSNLKQQLQPQEQQRQQFKKPLPKPRPVAPTLAPITRLDTTIISASVEPASTSNDIASLASQDQSSSTLSPYSRPSLSRASTEPVSPGSPSTPLSRSRANNISSPASPASFTLPLRPPRNRSPYARTPHLRSRSAASSTLGPVAAATTMIRANSSPSPLPHESNTFQHHFSSSPTTPFAPHRPSSPLYTSTRRSSPFRRPMEESSFSGVEIDQTIAEHSELDLTPRPPAADPETLGNGIPSSPITPGGSLAFSWSSYPATSFSSSTFPRVRRRPSSPLQNLQLPSSPLRSSSAKPVTLHTSSSSPALRSISSPLTKYNESYPLGSSTSSTSTATVVAVTTVPSSTSSSASMYSSVYPASSSASASVPSTPTSFRSRSPSISSLETIPDSPDAEIEATEAAERDRGAIIARLRAAAERERRGSFEGNRGRGIFRDSVGGGSGSSNGSQKERKRWSVCGAERRGDLDLETIWED